MYWVDCAMVYLLYLTKAYSTKGIDCIVFNNIVEMEKMIVGLPHSTVALVLIFMKERVSDWLDVQLGFNIV